MFRTGRSPKSDSTKNQPRSNIHPQTFQPTQAQAAPQTFETPERPAATPTQERTPSAPRAVTESEALARDLRDGVVSGFVGGGTTVSGDAEFKGMLRVDGHFTGRIRSEKGSLIVSAGGVVDADIAVASAKINGTVNGDIVATQRIEFGRSARVRGNISTPALIIEEGANFEGGCRMQKPEAEALKTPKPAEKSIPVAVPQAKTATASKPSSVTSDQTSLPKPATRAAAALNASEAAG
jgi:cytoskeletal protein CcmA (bactofilin family)